MDYMNQHSQPQTLGGPLAKVVMFLAIVGLLAIFMLGIFIGVFLMLGA